MKKGDRYVLILAEKEVNPTGTVTNVTEAKFIVDEPVKTIKRLRGFTCLVDVVININKKTEVKWSFYE